jgi:ABC-type Fe3+/spermidine/putrescine transport system ATPase subunit
MSGIHSDRRGTAVRLESVSKSFGAIRAVNSVSLEIQEGSFFSLLGPSGCGKSTTLRLVAGFETPDEGTIRIGERDVTSLSPRKRPTAMVFQSYALFPHMTVGQNVAYGLKVNRVESRELSARVASALDRVGLSGQTEQDVTTLSGGQQQRVALARAIAVEPEVLLFDEPLSNLDVALREQTRREIKHMQANLGTTSIYVTHDQEEAMALSDTIAVMNAGRVIQVGSPDVLYNTPKTAFVARFLGSSNILSRVGASRVSGESRDSVAPQDSEKASSPETLMMVRPEHVRISTDGSFEGRVVDRHFLGSRTVFWIEWDGGTLRAESLTSPAPVEENVRFDIETWRWVIDDTDEENGASA